MTALAGNALTERYATITSDHERIHQALYQGFTEPYCPSRSNLIRAILRERSAGLLCNDSFDSILSVASDPRRRGTVFSLFKVALPRDMACA
ncbi:MAG: hypothetical protein KA240_09615 [Nitrospira sp.]|uniref:hypothetical protein n=1 Tax=Accumulibacter sp. TaxID=2053492 RepID=UPI001B511481|nr:hypothetical protein [Accumulibacter sp.]MBP6605929.1 hypothetical protein [Nitrospira sp.]